jgi:hypothetical protein
MARVIEITFLLIVLYLVLSNSNSFATVINAASGAYSSSVKVLQGR